MHRNTLSRLIKLLVLIKNMKNDGENVAYGIFTVDPESITC